MKMDLEKLLSTHLDQHDFFEKYEEYREGFIASTCTTLSKNPRAVKQANKELELIGEDLGRVLSKYPNPYLKFRDILNPTLWKNFELISTVFHYTNVSKLEGNASLSMIRISSKCNKEIDNAMKSDLDQNLGKALNTQFRRLIKFIKNYDRVPNKDSISMNDVDNTVMVMTIVKEHDPEYTYLKSNTALSNTLDSIVYRPAMYYLNNLNIGKDREDLIQRVRRSLTDEVKAVFELYDINPNKNEYLFSELSTRLSLSHLKSKEEIKEALNKTSLKDELSYSSFRTTLLRAEDREESANNSEVMFKDDVEILKEIVLQNHLTCNIQIIETEDTVLTSDELYLAIGNELIKAYVCSHKVDALMLMTNIYTSVRFATLMKSYKQALKEQPTIEVITVENSNSNSLPEELNEYKKKVQSLQLALDNSKAIEMKNAELTSENSRLKDQLEKQSNNEKELQSLRSFMYANSSNYFDNDSKVDTLQMATDYLNSKEVYLIGGAPPWAHRLKKVLPNLKYFDADSQNLGLVNKLKSAKAIIIYNTELNSHGMYYQIMPAIEKNDEAKLVMINSHGNINRLIEYVHQQVEPT